MSILLGSSQSLSDTWVSNYFPEDLPPDWRFSYYGNDYPIVLFNVSNHQQATHLIEYDWPETLYLVILLTTGSTLDHDYMELLKLLAKKHEQLLFLSAEVQICERLMISGLGCELCTEVNTAEYEIKGGGQSTCQKIMILHDAGGDLRALRRKFEKYSRHDGDTWVFLDSSPSRLDQIKIMLDLMGIRA